MIVEEAPAFELESHLRTELEKAEIEVTTKSFGQMT